MSSQPPFQKTVQRKFTYVTLRFTLPTELFRRLERDCAKRTQGGDETVYGRPMIMQSYLSEIIECWAAALETPVRGSRVEERDEKRVEECSEKFLEVIQP